MIKWIKRIFCTKSFYQERLEALHKCFLEETKKDKLLAAFAEFLLPTSHYFDNNCVEDRWIQVDRYQFPEICEMGIKYFMGMKIIWLPGRTTRKATKT